MLMQRSVVLHLSAITGFIAALSSSPAYSITPATSLSLYQKCTNPGNVCPTDPGPWPKLAGSARRGTLAYNLWGSKFTFTFSGQRLTKNKLYTLIYYPDPWPGNGLICLSASTKANLLGNLSISRSINLKTSLPTQADANFATSAPGAKIWLVPSADVNCNTKQMVNWNPGEILFENNSIIYTDTDAPN